MAKEEKNQLVEIHHNIDRLLREKASALPKNFNQTRFLQNCMSVLQDTPDIQKMTPLSIARTMLKGAFLGLDFFSRECYAIPYSKNIGTKQAPKYVKELQFQTDYKGEIKLAKKYSLKKIHDIYAKVVRKGDKFEEYVREGKQNINFTPKPFNNEEIEGAFAICLYADGSILYETMGTKEIERVRQVYSKVPTGKAWKESWGEMAKKTVLRRLCKLIEIEFESIEQATEYKESGDFEFDDKMIVDAEPILLPKEVESEQSQEETENVQKINKKQYDDLLLKKKDVGMSDELFNLKLAEYGYNKGRDITVEHYQQIYDEVASWNAKEHGEKITQAVQTSLIE